VGVSTSGVGVGGRGSEGPPVSLAWFKFGEGLATAVGDAVAAGVVDGVLIGTGVIVATGVPVAG